MAKTQPDPVSAGSKTVSSKRRSGGNQSETARSVNTTAPKANAILFTGTVKKPESQMTPIEKMERLHKGIRKKELETLKARTGLDYDKLSALLSVTRATLINKPRTATFSSSLSERILALAALYSYGYDVFEDEKTFNQWMFIPNRALGGKTPYEVCNNQFGREEVKHIIGRIDYGIYS